MAIAIVDYSNGQGTTWAFCYSFAVTNIGEGYLKLITTRAGVVKHLIFRFKIKIFNFYLIVYLTRHICCQLYTIANNFFYTFQGQQKLFSIARRAFDIFTSKIELQIYMKRERKAKGVKIEVDNTLVTQSDITLSLSRESFKERPLKKSNSQLKKLRLQSISFDESYELSNIDTDALELLFAQKFEKHSKNNKPIKQEQNDEVNLSVKTETKDYQKGEKSQQIKSSDSEEHKQQDYNPYQDQNFHPRQDDDQLKNQGEILNQEAIRQKMKEIDINIKRLHLQRNRLKYFLRKDKEVNDSQGQDNLATKQCPCCGKLISKLCFRCQHLYCKVQNCPRKKKQVLNARMLQKMREKKVVDPVRRRRKRQRLQQKKKEKQQQGLDFSEGQFQSFDDQASSISQFSHSLEEAFRPKLVKQTKKEVDLSDMLKRSMSDTSMLRNSQLFLDSVDL